MLCAGHWCWRSFLFIAYDVRNAPFGSNFMIILLHFHVNTSFLCTLLLLGGLLQLLAQVTQILRCVTGAPCSVHAISMSVYVALGTRGRHTGFCSVSVWRFCADQTPHSITCALFNRLLFFRSAFVPVSCRFLPYMAIRIPCSTQSEYSSSVDWMRPTSMWNDRFLGERMAIETMHSTQKWHISISLSSTPCSAMALSADSGDLMLDWHSVTR